MTESGDAEVSVAQNLIRLLFVNETQENQHAPTEMVERVFEALRVRLSSVLGAGGYATLLARSLTLTRSEFPWLAAIIADKNGSISGLLGTAIQEQAPAELMRGFATLLTRFASLLTTFIGADLTNRLLESVWQDLGKSNTDQSRGENNL